MSSLNLTCFEYISIYFINYRWNNADLQTTCRHLGYRGGRFLRWMESKRDKLHTRLMLSNLQCQGIENDLVSCVGWGNKKLGSGSCGKFLFFFLLLF